MYLVLDELLLASLHHALEVVQLLLVVHQHLVTLQEEQVLHTDQPINESINPSPCHKASYELKQLIGQ